MGAARTTEEAPACSGGRHWGGGTQGAGAPPPERTPRLREGEPLAARDFHRRISRAAMKPRLFDGEHTSPAPTTTSRGLAAMKPRLFDGEHKLDEAVMAGERRPQ